MGAKGSVPDLLLLLEDFLMKYFNGEMLELSEGLRFKMLF